MDKSTETDLAHLLYVLKAPSQLREELLQSANNRIVIAFCELVINIYQGVVEVDQSEKQIIADNRKVIEKIFKQNVKANRLTIAGLDASLLDLFSFLLEKYV